ncbi:hypothetical protein [uncultured Corynebacterium sp.]|uniref:hypothetical protein n=1 Tax=uncultured Corynebacterium sp. TaxID=159447 RepID=UPI0025F02443|nr:hypothetical protein [uncultured Corynebacterium sp.]
MFKRTIAVAMSVVGLIVGAGFSSGQEVLQYFVAFGKMGVWGAVIVAVLMSAAGMIVLQLGSYFQADEQPGFYVRSARKRCRGSWTLALCSHCFPWAL